MGHTLLRAEVQQMEVCVSKSGFNMSEVGVHNNKCLY